MSEPSDSPAAVQACVYKMAPDCRDSVARVEPTGLPWTRTWPDTKVYTFLNELVLPGSKWV